MTVDLSNYFLMFLEAQHVFHNVLFWLPCCILLTEVVWLVYKWFWHLVIYVLLYGLALLILSRFYFYFTPTWSFYNFFLKLYAFLFFGSQEQSFPLGIWNLSPERWCLSCTCYKCCRVCWMSWVTSLTNGQFTFFHLIPWCNGSFYSIVLWLFLLSNSRVQKRKGYIIIPKPCVGFRRPMCLLNLIRSQLWFWPFDLHPIFCISLFIQTKNWKADMQSYQAIVLS